ncbi:MAG: patatin-like phospholipase family protein [Gammaproteobacteria bacterium]
MTSERQELPYGFQISAVTDKYGTPLADEKRANSLRYSFYLNPIKIRVIAFKGGGARGFAYEKFIQIIEENGTLQHVREVGGSSAGAIASIFTAMHFEPGKRAKVLENFDTANATDIMGNSWWWKAYRAVTWPLYIISKPFTWLADGISYLAKGFNSISPGQIIGWPLSFLSGVVRLFTILSPEGIAGIANLITKGGLYKGERLQNSLCRIIQRCTYEGYLSILKKIREKEKRDEIERRMLEIGFLKRTPAGIKMVANITFEHFYELSRLPGSQFKELFITATKINSGDTHTFNYKNTPKTPIYQAVRRSMSLPWVFQHDGEYMDGGCSDNFPIRRASSKKYGPFMEQYSVDDRLARLGVRVDHHHELDHLWKKAKQTKFAQVISRVWRWVAKVFAGMDTYAADDEVTEAMQNDYAQQTIALYDHGVGVTEFDLSKVRRKELNEGTEKTVNEFFNLHRNEKVAIENYQDSREMPLWMQMKLLEQLKDKNIPSENLFSCNLSYKSAQDLEALRQREIQKLEQPHILAWKKQVELLQKPVPDKKARDEKMLKAIENLENKSREKFTHDAKRWATEEKTQREKLSSAVAKLDKKEHDKFLSDGKLWIENKQIKDKICVGTTTARLLLATAGKEEISPNSKTQKMININITEEKKLAPQIKSNPSVDINTRVLFRCM